MKNNAFPKCIHYKGMNLIRQPNRIEKVLSANRTQPETLSFPFVSVGWTTVQQASVRHHEMCIGQTG